VIYLGSPVFKIARLLFVAMFSVHLFACIFYLVKNSSAFAPEDVATFYTSKNVEESVSANLCQFDILVSYMIFFMQDLGGKYVSYCSYMFHSNYTLNLQYH
jgi:hypothetical protein